MKIENFLLINVITNFLTFFVILSRAVYFFENLKKVLIVGVILSISLASAIAAERTKNKKLKEVCKLISGVFSVIILAIVILLLLTNNSRNLETYWLIMLFLQLVSYLSCF